MLIQVRRHNQSIMGAITLRVNEFLDLSDGQLKRVEQLLQGEHTFLVCAEKLWGWRERVCRLKYQGRNMYAIVPEEV